MIVGGTTDSGDFYVYLHKTMSGRIFYVGKGKGRRANDITSRSGFWKSVFKKHGRLVEFIATGLDEATAFRIEMEAIASLRRMGLDLCNMNDGGPGFVGKRSNKHLRTVSQAGKLAWADPAKRANITAALAEASKRPEVRRNRRNGIAAAMVRPDVVERRRELCQSDRFREIRRNASARMDKVKKILCVETGEVFISARDAGRRVRPDSKSAGSMILEVCKGLKTRVTAYGFHWRFA